MSRLAFLPVAASAVLLATACSQTPVLVPVRSMERPKDVDLICLHQLDGVTWKGAPLEMCGIDDAGSPVITTGAYHLHAIVTQFQRGELASVDLGYAPLDPDATVGQIVKLDPRLPGFTFLPVGKIPQDVTTDPAGQAVYVSSGRESRIDVIPAELLRGPIDTSLENGEDLPWPHLDFTPNDGVPSRLAVVRDKPSSDAVAYGAGRLYVTLPEARGGPRIAVFDLGDATNDKALLPPRMADIPLVFKEPSQLRVASLACGKTHADATPPWWVPLDVCGGGTTTFTNPPPPVTLPTYTESRLAGIQLVNGFLFAADDKAPFIHVFDVRTGEGVEIQRIPIGVATSNLALSEPVPDEVTQYNAAAIETCEAQGWMGDGKEHRESSLVEDKLGGHCNLHRYLYAVNPVNVVEGDGSVPIIDIPITYGAGADGKPSRALEQISFADEALVHPMGCDSPAFRPSRIALGTFGIGGNNAVPAQSMAFVKSDPQSTVNLKKSVRCHPADDVDLYDKGTADPFAQKDSAYISAATGWQVGIDPRRMRGTFAYVLLKNGSLAVVDIDDYDSLCRGPNPSTTATYFDRSFDNDLSSVSDIVGTNATGEFIRQPVRRHHPRSARFLTTDNPPTVANLSLTRGTNSLSFETSTTEGQTKPHLLVLNSKAVKPFKSEDYILPSADNPYTLAAEAWTVTYQGILPGFTGTAGSFITDGTTPTLIDPGGRFCTKGVEALVPDRHDVVQIIEPVCDAQIDGGPCSQAEHDQCAAVYGIPDVTDPNQVLPSTRDLIIDQAFEGKLTIAQHFEVNATSRVLELKPGFPAAGPTDLAHCFRGLTRYVVRSRDTWVVIGTSTGYLHDIVPDFTKADLPCTVDPTRPRIYHGRVQELPYTTNIESPPSDNCSLFVNPSWKFAIAQGYSGSNTSKTGGVPSARDMRFVFSTRFIFTPLVVTMGSEPTAIRPVVYYRDGVDLLNWAQTATIDSVERGLNVFNNFDLTSRQTL